MLDYNFCLVEHERKKEAVITCPRCGCEYLPAEVYVPEAFFGKPEDIDRTSAGKIDVYGGTAMDLHEEYTCEHCGATFEVTAEIKFKTAEKTEEDFDSVFTSPLPQRISLFEEDSYAED